MIDPYLKFLTEKAMIDPMTGMSSPPELIDALFPFQRDIVNWALKRGRAAIFAGTGLGKSLMELSWADAVVKETGKKVLHLAPLAVSNQMIREADKFGLSSNLVAKQADCSIGNNITNYQKLDHFDLSQFGGVILDESSILKSDHGKYKTALIEACQSIPFRLAATATPAPNDFTELGNHAEFLGVMKFTDMLATFFVHDGGSTQNWRLKGHAENEFWKWMAQWAVMLRTPSDLGYDNTGYDLPPLVYYNHVVKSTAIQDGYLFAQEAQTLSERISARRDTVKERLLMTFDVVIGSACDKLAEWHGNQNTLSAEGQNINLTQRSEIEENPKAGIQTKTLNTCENTTLEILKNLSEQLSSGKKTMRAVENDTPRIKNTARSAKEWPEIDLLASGETAGSNLNTASIVQNTITLLKDSPGFAPYAEQSLGDAFTLITAMKQAKLEGFFAARAIQASDISRMTKSGLIEPWCIWCNLNSEQDGLARLFGPLAYSVSGSMGDDEKEKTIFDWMDRKRPIMISKPSIMGFGMNFQHCSNTAFVGLNDSFEQYYQAIRRFWRFGQARQVDCHIISADTEGATVANIRRKEADADRMSAAMVMHTASLTSAAIKGQMRDIPDYNPQQEIIIPEFLRN